MAAMTAILKSLLSLLFINISSWNFSLYLHLCQSEMLAHQISALHYFIPGEYVIMVQDITNPPFLGKKLDPAFLLVKVTKPKKVKKEKEKQPK